MVHYLPYNVNSDVRVEETLTIRAGKAFLRHIPKKGSVVIDGFTEVDSVILQDYQFSCQYALDSLYRDADRVLQFSRTHDGQSISVSYVAIGTVVTADDMNEIKAHMESPHVLPTMAPNVKGGAKNGTGLVMADDTVNVDLRTAVETSSTDAEPRVYVICSGLRFKQEYPDITDNDLYELSVKLSGVENHRYLLIDDIYVAVDSSSPSGGLFNFGEWYVPVRGQENFTVRAYGTNEDGAEETKNLVAGQDFFIGLDDAEEQPILTFYHDGTYYPEVFNMRNATIWADGHDAVEGAKSIGNIVLGNNLSLTGDTLNVIGDTLNASVGGSCEAFFCYAQPEAAWVGDTSSLPFTYHDKSWDSTHYAFADFEQAFQEKCGRPSQLGDIVHWMNTGLDEGYAYRAADKWFNLTDKNNSDGWKKINPLLTENDRRLLDYLHTQFDSQIPT